MRWGGMRGKAQLAAGRLDRGHAGNDAGVLQNNA